MRDPRLFRQLLLWPLFVGVFLASGQILISAAYLHLLEETPEQFKERVETRDSTVDWVQGLIYGKATLPEVPEVCRWTSVNGEEVAPSASCKTEEFDVVLRAPTPDFDITPFIKYFSGATKRLHICDTCKSDIVLDFPDGVTTSHVFSLKAVGVFVIAQENRNSDVNAFFMQAKLKAQQLEDLTGTVLLQARGMDNAMDMTHATAVMVFVINTCMMIVASLWLTLNGYRKVLRCFAENNALLPLVSVCGKWEFYLSIWIITLARVSLFLFVSIPMAFIAYRAAVPEETRQLFMPNRTVFFAWLFAVSSSLALVTVVASLSELLRRHSFFSVVYRYVPLFLVVSGTLLWAYSMVTGNPALLNFQKGMIFVPIIGLSPVILTPIISQPVIALLTHGVFACCLVWVLLRRHATWFAAHLEEV